MGTNGSKIIAGSVVASASAMAAVESFMPVVVTPSLNTFGGLLAVTIAAIAGGWFAAKAVKANFGVKGWLVAGPLFFAVLGFGLWAGCLSATYLLARMTDAQPTISFLEFLGGLFTYGYNYALLGLIVGLVWSIPVATLLAATAIRQFFSQPVAHNESHTAKQLMAR